MKRFGLSKKERVRSKKEFELVFTNGTTVYSKSQKLKATFYFDKDFDEKIIKAAFAVHKKTGNAVWRNRVRRLLREAYRFNKERLSSSIKCGQLLIVFSLSSINKKNYENIFLKDIIPDLVELIEKINSKV